MIFLDEIHDENLYFLLTGIHSAKNIIFPQLTHHEPTKSIKKGHETWPLC